jgi:hypothetical protein
MHQHLVDLSHLACSSYDELVKHRSGYEQAYLLECRKLQQNVAEYNALALDHKRLEQENSYYQQQLLPHYHHLFYRQEQETQEARKQTGSSEARSRELEKKSIEQALTITPAFEYSQVAKRGLESVPLGVHQWTKFRPKTKDRCDISQRPTMHPRG